MEPRSIRNSPTPFSEAWSFPRRDLNVAATNIDPEGLYFATRVDWQENLARTYLFWAPRPWLALRAEYQYEHYSKGSP